MQKMRVRILLAREAIRERMEEPEHPVDYRAQPTYLLKNRLAPELLWDALAIFR